MLNVLTCRVLMARSCKASPITTHLHPAEGRIEPCPIDAGPSDRPARSVHLHKLLWKAVSGACFLLVPVSASANCVVGPNSATCNNSSPNPFTGTVGNGRNTASPFSVLLSPGAQIQTTNANAISVHTD